MLKSSAAGGFPNIGKGTKTKLLKDFVQEVALISIVN